MPRTIHQPEKSVILTGYQAILKPSKYGYSLATVIPESMIKVLEEERAENIKWCESKLKNPKRSTMKPEPWEESDTDSTMYKVKFSYNDENRPPVVDTEGTHLTDENIPLYEGSEVKIAFYQKPYILKDGVTYGTTLKLVGVQVVALNSGAGVDTGDMDPTAVAALFGTTKGYKTSDVNVTPSTTEEEDDF